MFQSLTRPYFFHGSVPAGKLPYFLKSYTTRVSWDPNAFIIASVVCAECT